MEKKICTKEFTKTKRKKMQYSGYPASEFPKQCGVGFGGHGQYGTYPKCATNDHAHANHVDYDPSLLTCGSTPQRPNVSSCKAPKQIKNSSACSVEAFTGQGAGCEKPVWFADKSCTMPPRHCGATKCGVSDAENPGCKKPEFWSEQSCHMPPTHCGASKCGSSTGAVKITDVPGVENYDGTVGHAADEYPGAMSAACNMNPVSLDGTSDCDAQLTLSHEVGCTCTNCAPPYSMPYAAGPGCGKPWCRCKSCDGKCGGGGALKKLAVKPAFGGMFGRNITITNVLIALVVAAITYRMLRK